MLLEDDRPRGGLGPNRSPHVLRQPEARPTVGDPDGLLAEHVLHDVAAARVVREADDGVSVRVDHRLGVEEAVEEGLDRRPRGPGLLKTPRKVVDHLLVAHFGALEKGVNLREAHPGKVPARHALEVGAAALDAEDPHRAAEDVGLGELHRRVAPAPHRERGLRSHPARHLDELIDEVEPAQGFLLVAAFHDRQGSSSARPARRRTDGTAGPAGPFVAQT